MTSTLRAWILLGASLNACGSASSSSTTSTPGPAPGGSSSTPEAPSSPGAPAPSPPATPPGAPAPGTCSGKSTQSQEATWKVHAGGVERVFHVHVPASYDPSSRAPLVLNFHGFTSDALQEELLSKMNAKSDEKGFVAVYPEGLGTPQSWNAGACCGYAAATHVDDIGFVTAMLDDLEAKLCIDAHRLFVTGMSNGAFLSHRIACELSTRVAAIAPVAGVLGVPTCSPARPVPVMEFHGTLDPLVPYGGDPALGFPSVASTFAGWASRDACSGAPKQTYSDHDSQCETYEACSGGATVTLCTVTGGGHTWPGGMPVPRSATRRRTFRRRTRCGRSSRATRSRRREYSARRSCRLG